MRGGVSDEFLSQLEEFANALMDGADLPVTDRAIGGAMVRVLVDELLERRAADAKSVLPVNQETERMVDAMMASSIKAATTSRKLTMPALSDADRKSLAGLCRYLSHPDINGGGEPEGLHAEWLAVIERLLAIDIAGNGE